MKIWNKVYVAAQFTCAAMAIGVITSNIQDCPLWLMLAGLVSETFMIYNGIDALKED